MYMVEIIEPDVKGLDADGKIVDRPVGTIIYDARAWELCLTSVFHPKPRAKPVDEATQAKLDAEIAILEPRISAEMVLLQQRIDALAAKHPAAVDKATGFFKRNAKGEFDKSLDNVGVFIAELAEQKRMKPKAAEPK